MKEDKEMKGSRILLVDDETVFTDNMTRLLTTRGYLVTAVDNGEAALQILGEKEFDVIVLDLKMPGMDGITTFKEIGKMGLFAQTLILTGHGSIDTALEAIKLGAYDYLTKPCEIDDLVNKKEGLNFLDFGNISRIGTNNKNRAITHRIIEVWYLEIVIHK
jgi:DNA-binding NtrC family response regulator